ncbi:hypothetical protein, partial [Halomonas sp. BM-2019]|uniref:hypothetical protein n=1 Tax=Halomonas sp. BM-2019 TaxID=2811227 RepID=UPI001B3C2520
MAQRLIAVAQQVHCLGLQLLIEAPLQGKCTTNRSTTGLVGQSKSAYRETLMHFFTDGPHADAFIDA